MEYETGKTYKLNNCELEIYVNSAATKESDVQRVQATYIKIIEQHSEDFVDVVMGNSVFNFGATLSNAEVNAIISKGQ
jgi:hypothetical protein